MLVEFCFWRYSSLLMFINGFISGSYIFLPLLLYYILQRRNFRSSVLICCNSNLHIFYSHMNCFFFCCIITYINTYLKPCSFLNLQSLHTITYSLIITLPTNRAKLEPFDKTNAGSPHKYRLSAFQPLIQTQSFRAAYW